MATDQEYTNAAAAVAAGNATPAQVELNERMASNSRTFSKLAQMAQDARKTKS